MGVTGVEVHIDTQPAALAEYQRPAATSLCSAIYQIKGFSLFSGTETARLVGQHRHELDKTRCG